jgi:hypothetical protein
MVKARPCFLKVSHEKGALRIVPCGGDKWARLKFEDFRGEAIWVSPQLFGKFLVLGVSKEIDSQTARNILELLQEEIPKLYRLRNFLLREPPEGSSEEVAQAELRGFNLEEAELYCEDERDYYQVRILDGGDAECSCGKFKAGTWCRHIRFLHQVLREEYSPNVKHCPYHLPLWPIKELSEGAKLVVSLGGFYTLLSKPRTYPDGYQRRREVYYTPMLGVEFEVPRGRDPDILLLRRIITVLKEKGIVLAYERDASVEGGEIKLKPFPATVEECLEKGNLLKAIREALPLLFEDDRLAGIHVHINMYPFEHLSKGQIERKLASVVRLFESRFDLALLFGRGFNHYALKREEASRENARYGWVNFRPLPYTVEVRLGCAKKGDPVKILLVSLLLQRVFWARLEGKFNTPSPKASRKKLLSAFADPLSEEERKHIVPLLEEALL